MEFRLDHAVAVLERTPGTVRTLLEGLPDDWTRADEGRDTWSPFDIVGHLIHGEMTDWIPRARIILEHGASRTFEPFDRFAQIEQNRGVSLGELLDTFERLRGESLESLAAFGLTPSHLELRGRHPEFGEVTLGQLLATWAAHDLSHIAQIARVMARQYAEAVGPWKRYLPILEYHRTE